MAGLGNTPSGRCDVCHLDCLKLAPLTCLRHFCCNTCRKHCNKLQKNQFYCNICERREFESQTERRRESRAIDSFIDGASNQRKNSTFKDVQLTMTGSKLISLNDDQDDNDQSDLTGNNDEWELLISSLSYKPSCAEPAGQQKSRSPPKVKSPSNHHKTGTQKPEPNCKDKCFPQKESHMTRSDKYSDDSRIYNWCLAAEKSLSSAPKCSARFEPLHDSNEPACFSSSSENHMGMKKFQRQTKKKERPIWCGDSESEEEEWDECFSRRTIIDMGEHGEPKSNAAVTAIESAMQADYNKPDYINIPVETSEDSQLTYDGYTVNMDTRLGQKAGTKVNETPSSVSKYGGGVGSSNVFFSKGTNEPYSYQYQNLGQSSGNIKNVTIDDVWNKDSNKYGHTDVNSTTAGQNPGQFYQQDHMTMKPISQSRGLGNLTMGYNEQFQLGNKGFPRVQEIKVAMNKNVDSEIEKTKMSNMKKNILSGFEEATFGHKDLNVVNNFGRSLRKDVQASHGNDLKLSQPVPGRKAGDDSDGSSYDCGSIEGPLSDREFTGFENEDSRWLRGNPTGTPVDLHDTFWDQ